VINDITKKIIVRVDANVKDAEKAIASFNEEARDTTDALDSVALSSMKAEKALDTIGLGAGRQVGRWQQLTSAFQGFTGKLGGGLSAIDDFAKKLAPWNQALELGGKAVKFADEAMGAYAKTSKEAAREVEKLRSEFAGLRDSAMAAGGAIVVGLLKPLQSLRDLEQQLRNAQDGLGAFQRGWQSAAFGAGGPTAIGGIESALGGVRSLFAADPWSTGPSADDLLSRLKPKAGKPRPSQFGDFASVGGFDRLGGAGGSSSLGFTAGINIDERALLDRIEGDRTAALTADWQKRLAEQQAQKTNFLESSFGKLEDFNAYATAFETLTGAVSASLDAWIDGSSSAGDAFKKFLGEALKGVASQMAVESLKHAAYAIGSLAFGDVRGAATHGAAAAAFGLGAGAAAVAAKQFGGGAGAPSAPSGASSTGSGASGGGSQASSGSAGGGDRVIIAYASPFAQDNHRSRAREARRIVGEVIGDSSQEDS
jgi:hypothetical protein